MTLTFSASDATRWFHTQFCRGTVMQRLALCGMHEGVRQRRCHVTHEPVNVDESSRNQPQCWNVVRNPEWANSSANRWNNVTQAGLCARASHGVTCRTCSAWACVLTHLSSSVRLFQAKHVWPEGWTRCATAETMCLQSADNADTRLLLLLYCKDN